MGPPFFKILIIDGGRGFGPGAENKNSGDYR